MKEELPACCRLEGYVRLPEGLRSAKYQNTARAIQNSLLCISLAVTGFHMPIGLRSANVLRIS